MDKKNHGAESLDSALVRALKEADERVEPLDTPLEPVRVIEQDDAKLFTCRAAVLTKDTLVKLTAFARDLNCDVAEGLAFGNPVPVKDRWGGNVVGNASLFWEGDVMIAEVVLPYSSEERLLIQTSNVYAESDLQVPGSGDASPIRMLSLWLTPRRPKDEGETPLREVNE